MFLRPIAGWRHHAAVRFSTCSPALRKPRGCAAKLRNIGPEEAQCETPNHVPILRKTGLTACVDRAP
jgi:hypothetical protein